jgi:hypothetical protein
MGILTELEMGKIRKINMPDTDIPTIRKNFIGIKQQKNHVLNKYFKSYKEKFDEYLFKTLNIFWNILNEKGAFSDKYQQQLFYTIYNNVKLTLNYIYVLMIVLYDSEDRKGKVKQLKNTKEFIADEHYIFWLISNAIRGYQTFMEMYTKDANKFKSEFENVFRIGNPIERRENYPKYKKVIGLMKTFHEYYPEITGSQKKSCEIANVSPQSFNPWKSKNKEKFKEYIKDVSKEDIEGYCNEISKYVKAYLS